MLYAKKLREMEFSKGCLFLPCFNRNTSVIMSIIKFMGANSMLVDVKHFIKVASLTCITALSGDNTFAHNFETVKSTISTYVKKVRLTS